MSKMLQIPCATKGSISPTCCKCPCKMRASISTMKLNFHDAEHIANAMHIEKFLFQNAAKETCKMKGCCSKMLRMQCNMISCSSKMLQIPWQQFLMPDPKVGNQFPVASGVPWIIPVSVFSRKPSCFLPFLHICRHGFPARSMSFPGFFQVNWEKSG